MKKRGSVLEWTGLFHVSPADIADIVGGFHSEMKRGLAGEPSSLKMLPSFVAKPRGSETGRYLALDLGGTNLRILAVELEGEGRFRIPAVDKVVVPGERMRGKGEDLFDFLAECILAFAGKGGEGNREDLRLAFTFSFPTEQTRVDAGRLLVWTKGFTATGVEGEDVVDLLTRSLRRKGAGFVRIVALVNDTVGTLAAKAYTDRTCDMGVILGTGTNACYVEETARITKRRGLGAGGEMIVNLEWGNFALLRRTPFDADLDRDSPNPGSQLLEKMVSGLYLGELARRVIRALMNEGLLFDGSSRDLFTTPYAFGTEHLSAIASDDFGVLARFGIGNLMENDRILLTEICRAIVRRSARIAGAAVAAVAAWMDPELKRNHTVGIDGTLFECYPGYPAHIRGALADALGPRADRVRLEPAKDGSGIGAAVIAAVVGAQ